MKKEKKKKRRIINITLGYSSLLCSIRQSPLVTSFDVDPPSKSASKYVKQVDIPITTTLVLSKGPCNREACLSRQFFTKNRERGENGRSWID